jgi:HMGL-like
LHFSTKYHNLIPIKLKHQPNNYKLTKITIMSEHQPKVLTFDTTQRDGMQTPGIRSWTIDQHRQHAIAVEESGVSMIEAGFASAGQNIQDQIIEISKVVRETQVFIRIFEICKKFRNSYILCNFTRPFEI